MRPFVFLPLCWEEQVWLVPGRMTGMWNWHGLYSMEPTQAGLNLHHPRCEQCTDNRMKTNDGCLRPWSCVTRYYSGNSCLHQYTKRMNWMSSSWFHIFFTIECSKRDQTITSITLHMNSNAPWDLAVFHKTHSLHPLYQVCSASLGLRNGDKHSYMSNKYPFSFLSY